MARLSLLTLLALGSAALAKKDTFQTKCAALQHKVKLPNVHVNFVEYVPGGTNLDLPDNAPSCGASSQAVSTDMCRIAMAVDTSDSSQITLEAWFPRDYTGRFLSTGNGGLSGCIQYYDLAYAAGLGFATVGANNGHNGTSGEPFYQHPEVVEDFAHRSVHTGVVVGKQLTKLFYDKGFKKSYYLGCSTGGRQGFKSVQKYPKDFDGIVAGAPAFNFVNLISWSAYFYSLTGSNTSESYLSPAMWKIAHDEIVRQCDELDGAKDGIIEDTDLCHPRLETIICKPGAKDTANCLTGAQAKTVRDVLSPMYGVNGTLLYPRMQPGSEVYAAGIMYNGEPFQYSTDWYRYVVYNNPDWDDTKWSVEDAAAALAQNPYDIQTFDADISSFRGAGGKVLTYHGLQDQMISSDNSKLYYARVAETMKLPPSELDEFYRFFPVSGMTHCAGGDGAYGIGNGLGSYNGVDPENNVLMAMVQWVEKGIAPEFIRGAKFAEGPGSAVEYTRKHCRYPRRNVYKGPGNYTDENAWECV
ncbi:putative feruloyl esterase [Aspergillus clavatus NRRL 1]|uniref:Probable feruloyl esterase B n=1 Tax=Aspergillus clavatus (strain ATCC 1007 / CBS 513.65 / DSM 816 / NCTC 3887 / NRRL 1 / QM 1276 / 107) TaxID=344612 RepID=FAEB_ASPCL|nr:feruloyl esterase, putative [Aspergillus clavatus NRRL 1]A1CTK4.1 RecName: Full=Probable feruloyl esterase B; AltName: Full=Ferulic acid esterase B; Short=FAEB; Flags: Precursor [Aspergillus clavatus NRRL 1]EAW06641.1 feruloyl esterase, putative [Aspergillus clavatus NRRL 1]